MGIGLILNSKYSIEQIFKKNRKNLNLIFKSEEYIE